jgi:hypothetical protein
MRLEAIISLDLSPAPSQEFKNGGCIFYFGGFMILVTSDGYRVLWECVSRFRVRDLLSWRWRH